MGKVGGYKLPSWWDLFPASMTSPRAHRDLPTEQRWSCMMENEDYINPSSTHWILEHQSILWRPSTDWQNDAAYLVHNWIQTSISLQYHPHESLGFCAPTPWPQMYKNVHICSTSPQSVWPISQHPLVQYPYTKNNCALWRRLLMCWASFNLSPVALVCAKPESLKFTSAWNGNCLTQSLWNFESRTSVT